MLNDHVMLDMENHDPIGSDLPPDEPAWYAVYTKSRHEQVAQNQLIAKGVEAFLPKLEIWSTRTDRRLRISVPMFPGYLFVRTSLEPERHLSILKTVGVVNLISVNSRPIPVDPTEIESLKILIDSGMTIHPTEDFRIGDPVRIVEGPFRGVTARLVDRRSRTRLIVAVETINRAVYVEIDDHLVRRSEAV